MENLAKMFVQEVFEVLYSPVKAFKKIIEKRDAGCAVLLISTELDEVLSLSDRVFVMYKGRIVAETDAAKANRRDVGLWMAGGMSDA